jgi:hypothetical protein
MTKKLKRYYLAWCLRKEGKKLHEIAEIMGFKSRENARRMIAWVNFRIKDNRPKSRELKQLLLKYHKVV